MSVRSAVRFTSPHAVADSRPDGVLRPAEIACIARCRELLDLVVAIVAAASRRASGLGRAATQRGGMRSVDH